MTGPFKKAWPELLATRYRQANPTHRLLLNLYNTHLSSPAFQPTRPEVLPHLREFDREGYISALPKPLPEEFETWIREWPAEAVISWVWPGLSGEFNTHSGLWTHLEQRFDFWRTYGSNKLAEFPPESAIVKLDLSEDDPIVHMTTDEREKLGYGSVEWRPSWYLEDDDHWGDVPKEKRGNWALHIQALEIKEHGCGWSTFLLLNGAGEKRNGAVWYIECFRLDDRVKAKDEYYSSYGGKVANGWVDWLEQEMEAVEAQWVRWRDKNIHTIFGRDRIVS